MSKRNFKMVFSLVYLMLFQLNFPKMAVTDQNRLKQFSCSMRNENTKLSNLAGITFKQKNSISNINFEKLEQLFAEKETNTFTELKMFVQEFQHKSKRTKAIIVLLVIIFTTCVIELLEKILTSQRLLILRFLTCPRPRNSRNLENFVSLGTNQMPQRIIDFRVVGILSIIVSVLKVWFLQGS